MIQVEQWAEIRRLHRAEGRSIRAIAREFGLARNTVRAAVRSGAPPGYKRVGRGSIVDAVEDAIRRELQACPTMPTTVVAERIGWTRGLTGCLRGAGAVPCLRASPQVCQSSRVRPARA